MKLELKHLAPYLPYRLMIMHESGLFVEMTLSRKSGNYLCVESVLDGFGVPILRPMSDLTKEIEISGDTIIPVKYIRRTLAIIDGSSGDFAFLGNNIDGVGPNRFKFHNTEPVIFGLPYHIVEQLIEWHFDVFGLIEKGLAIKKDTNEN